MLFFSHMMLLQHVNSLIMYQNTDTYMLHRTLISCVYTFRHVQVYIHKVETRHLFSIFQRLYALFYIYYLLQQIRILTK